MTDCLAGEVVWRVLGVGVSELRVLGGDGRGCWVGAPRWATMVEWVPADELYRTRAEAEVVAGGTPAGLTELRRREAELALRLGLGGGLAAGQTDGAALREELATVREALARCGGEGGTCG